MDGPEVGVEVGVGEVIVGDPTVAIDAPKEDYRVRSTDYGARKRITEGCEPCKGANWPEACATVQRLSQISEYGVQITDC